MMELLILPAAERDLQDAYEGVVHRGPGSGRAFLDALELHLEQLRRFPLIGPVYHGPYRRLLMRRFRLGIFYAVEPDRLVVHAVLDLRQDPETIRRRLGESG